MFVFISEVESREFFNSTVARGFRWFTPIHLDCELYWDDEENICQVEHICPVCNRLSDRHYNCTGKLDGVIYSLEHCLLCSAVWFKEERDNA